MKTKIYEDFDLSIERAGERYRARVLNSPDGTGSNEFDLPFSDLEIENFILRFGQSRRTMRNIRAVGETVNRSLREFGTRLYGAVFNGPVSDRLRGSLAVVGQKEDTGLRIRLRLSDVPELIDVPWEYLFDSSNASFLTLSVNTPIVRYLDLPGQIKPLAVQPPLYILVMLSSPPGYAELDVEQEWQKLKDAVTNLENRGLVVLERMEKPTLKELQSRLRKHAIHIFHFIGHGGFDENAQDGVLILESEDGKAKPTSGKYLGTLLRDEKSVQLAVLNACEGGRTSRQDPFAGVGQSLVQSGIPAVVSMQFEISDQAAITLSQEFYAALADSYPVDAALAEARKAIFAQDNIVEWGTPVLYMRAQDGRIFDVTAVEKATTKTLQPVEVPQIDNTSTVSLSANNNETSVNSSVTQQKIGDPFTIASPAMAKLLPFSIKNLIAQFCATPTSIGIRIATWSAVIAMIGFFSPWSRNGQSYAVTGMSWMPESLIIPAVFFIVFMLRTWAGGRKDTKIGIPLIISGVIAILALIRAMEGAFVNYLSANYGLMMTIAGLIGILAGGIANHVLPSSEEQPDELRFSQGHIVAVAGAVLTLFAIFFLMARFEMTDSHSYRYFLARTGVLVVVSIQVWWSALIAQRRRRLTWIDFTSNFIAATVLYVIGVEGTSIYDVLAGGVSDALVLGFWGDACMLIGGVVNFFFWIRQNATKQQRG